MIVWSNEDIDLKYRRKWDIATKLVNLVVTKIPPEESYKYYVHEIRTNPLNLFWHLRFSYILRVDSFKMTEVTTSISTC